MKRDRPYSRFARTRPRPPEVIETDNDDQSDPGPSEQEARLPGWSSDGVSMRLDMWGTVWVMPPVDFALVLVAPELAADIAAYLDLGAAWLAEYDTIPEGWDYSPASLASTAQHYALAFFPLVRRIGVRLLRLNYSYTAEQAEKLLMQGHLLGMDPWLVHHAICETILAKLDDYRDALPPTQIDPAQAIRKARYQACVFAREWAIEAAARERADNLAKSHQRKPDRPDAYNGPELTDDELDALGT